MGLCDKIWVNVVNDVRNDDVNRSGLSEADTVAIENAVAEEERCCRKHVVFHANVMVFQIFGKP